MPARIRAVLGRLGRIKGVSVAIVSGRGLPDLSRKAAIKGITLIGNHGLSCQKKKLGIEDACFHAWSRLSKEAARRLESLKNLFPGCIIEPKGPDVSLHYRLVPAGKRARLLFLARQKVKGLRLAAKSGKMVLEFRPRTKRNKGWALDRLAQAMPGGWKRTGFCLYVGDDVTDEDAFRAVRRLGPRAFGVKVGGGPTRATIRLGGQGRIYRFLCGLEGALSCPRK
jgi:trehalose 6-phosphate phosphatase